MAAADGVAGRVRVHRASTNLELLFDLTFVVAVSQAAHALAEHLARVTWPAASRARQYLLRDLVVVILAAGVPAAFDGDYQAAATGYVVAVEHVATMRCPTKVLVQKARQRRAVTAGQRRGAAVYGVEHVGHRVLSHGVSVFLGARF